MPETNKADARVEEDAKGKLSGETLANALGFIAFMRSCGFTTDDEYGNNFYYMGEPTCVFLCFEPHGDYLSGLWGIYNYPICECDGFVLDEKYKEYARANVRICKGECGCPNWPRGGDQTVYGTEFKGVCSSVVCFFNPDAEALVTIKEMMEYWRVCIEKSGKPRLLN